MASATNSTTLYSRQSGQFTLTAYFNENSTSTANNTSNITVTATMSSSTSAFYETNAGTLAIYWHDNKDNTDILKSSTTLTSCGFPPDYSSQSVTSTFDTPHNNDGTLSGYAYAVWTLNKNIGGYVPNSGNVATANTALTTIPRAATLNLSVSSVTVGDTFWASNSPFVSGFTYTLVASNSNGSYTFYTKQSLTDLYVNTGVSASNFYRFLSATQNYADVTFTLTTYSGNTTIGTNTKTLIVNANATDVPTVTINSVDTGKAINGTNRTTLDLTGSNKRIINQWNTISSTWTATTDSRYNTTIASVKIRGQEVTTSPTTLTDISNGITMVATDARGNGKAIAESGLTFISYEFPSIVPTLKRNTSTDGHANLTFTGMFYNVDFGAETNSLTLEWYVREKGDTTYTQGATALTYTINSDNRTYKEAATISLVNPLDQVDGLFDYTKAYEFKFVATDKITTYTIENVILTKGIPNFVVFKNALMANGKRIDPDGLLDLIHPVGEVYTTTNASFNPNTAWGGTWVQLTSDAYFKIVSSNAGSLGGTSNQHKIPTSSMPSHTHTFTGGQSTTSENGSHTHPVYNDNNSGSNDGFYITGGTNVGSQTYMASEGSHTHTVTASGSNENTGGGQAYYPYYYGVYAWHRTA